MRFATSPARHLSLALPALLLTGCVVGTDVTCGTGGPVLTGSGTSRTEAREVSGFTRIEVIGSTDVVATIGGTTSVSVTSDDNLVELVTTRVRGDTLQVSLEDGSYSFRVGPVVRVTLPELVSVRVVGSADTTVEGLAGGTFRTVVIGSGEIAASGRVERLEARVQGSGDLKLAGLEAREANVQIEGSGDADVRVTEAIAVEVLGSGDVVYRGRPSRVSTSVDGSGSIEARGH